MKRGAAIPEETKLLVWRRDRGVCQRCMRYDVMGIDFHHMKYRGRGGSNDAINLVLLCSQCHRAVHDHKTNTSQFRTASYAVEGTSEADTI